MPDRRPGKPGSFGAHMDELVKHFPHEVATRKPLQPKPKMDSRALKEKIDIHALLFKMAWQMERED